MPSSSARQMAGAAPVGANVRDGATEFRVWAPDIAAVQLVLQGPEGREATHTMRHAPDGFHELTVGGVGDGALYRFMVDGRGPFPDPASRSQPHGVHGPSQVVDPSRYVWNDSGWSGLELTDTILYELHVGTFTPAGTFASAAARLPDLARLGVTAVELMPVADFAGRWNWGYDGVALFAPARCYGTPDDLRRFVDEAHRLQLAVYLDVVYNHLGPDGAYQGAFSPFYYSATHQSPWGAGINFDGPRSGPVRDYVVQNALAWVHEFHIDGLRLDATHAIVDDSHPHVVAELATAVADSLTGTSRRVHVMAEDSRNLARMFTPASEGGWGLAGVWSDDFHHQMRRALAGDKDGYYEDFDGAAPSIAATARTGWQYVGQHSSYFGGPRGTEPIGVPKPRFVFFVQNHDQVGNRAFGDRIHHEIAPAAWRAASTLLFMLPETPLLFMGQEWAASSPFLFFTDHVPELGRLVTEGRRREFAGFAAFSEAADRDRIPDPQDTRTREASGLVWSEREVEPHASVLRLYERLIALRRTDSAFRETADDACTIAPTGPDTLVVWRRAADGHALLAVVRLRGSGPGIPSTSAAGAPDFGSGWRPLLTTEDAPFGSDPCPASISPEPLNVEFARPGAVIFSRDRLRPSGELT